MWLPKTCAIWYHLVRTIWYTLHCSQPWTKIPVPNPSPKSQSKQPCAQNVSFGTIWYPLHCSQPWTEIPVSNPTTCHLVPFGTNLYHLVPFGTIWIEFVPFGTPFLDPNLGLKSQSQSKQPCAQNVPFGAIWYYLVPFGTIWYQLVPFGTNWYHLVPSQPWTEIPVANPSRNNLVHKTCHLVPFCTIWYRLVPFGTNWYQLVPIGTKWYHLVPFGTIWYQLVPFGTIWYQLVPIDTIWYPLPCSQPWTEILVPNPSRNNFVHKTCHLVPFGTIWYQLVPFGNIWYHLVPPSFFPTLDSNPSPKSQSKQPFAQGPCTRTLCNCAQGCAQRHGTPSCANHYVQVL
jgi:hypothetical protein